MALLVIPTLSLLLGQALAAVGSISVAAALLLTPIILVASFWLWWKGKKEWAFIVLFSTATFSLGYGMHYRLLHPRFAPTHLRLITDGKESLYIEGLLYREPERLPDRYRWYLKAERIWRPNGAQETDGNILITVRGERIEWRYGDRVRLWLRVRPPRNGGNPGGFDYEAYLARRQIYLIGFLESDTGVELVRRAGHDPWGWIEHLRREIGRSFARHLPHEHSVLMKALVVGDMGGISKEMRESFAAAGVAHVLSISGLHVGMLGLVTFLLVRFLGSFSTTLLLRWNLLKVAAFFSFLAVLFYTALAGGMVPTVRSAIMIGVYQLAILLDREEEIFSSLALAALLIGFIWPGVILDISFQLSFLAVLFIIWGLRSLREWWPVRKREELPQERSWWRSKLRPAALYLAVPFLATVGTGPMIAYHFGHLSLAGFLSNPLVVPLVGFLIVPLGILIGFLSLSVPALALPFLWVTEPLLTLTLGLVQFFAALPLASISTLKPSLIEAVILYVALCSIFSVRRRAHLYIVCCALFVALAGDGFYWRQQRWDRRDLRVTFLNVGHGDAAVVEFPRSKVLLIDAGGSATEEFDTGESIIAPFLRSRKIKKVDYLLLSHPRVDHYGGMKTIVEEFSPSEFWSGPGEGRTARYRELEEAVRKKGVKRAPLSSRDPCRLIEGVNVCVLYSPEGRADDSSVVTRLSFGRVSFLFAGDIERGEEGFLLQDREDMSSHVLKVPRHGSVSSSTEEFVAAVKPRLAIFSVGHRNPFGLPREEVISRYQAAGAEIFRTDEDGAIVVETDGERFRYWTYRRERRGALSP